MPWVLRAEGSLTLSGNTLYGMTEYGGDADDGVIFQMNTDGTGYMHLHEFTGEPDDGRNPRGWLTLSGDTLYGMTPYGGPHTNGGVVFSLVIPEPATLSLLALGGLLALRRKRGLCSWKGGRR